MGANEKTVGGGAATGVANGWNTWLQSQLPGQQPSPDMQQNAGRIQGLTQLMGMPGANKAAILQEIQKLQGTNTPGQSSGVFEGLINGAASGQMGDPSGANGILQRLLSGGPQASPQFTNPYTSPTYSGPNINPLATDMFKGQNGMADLSGIGRVGDTNVDVTQGMGQGVTGTQFDPILMRAIQQSMSGAPSVNSNAVSLAGPSQVDLNNPLVAAQTQGVERQKMIDIANLRARFGAEGAGSMGTGAQVGEGTLAAEYAPRLAAIQQQAIQFQQQQDLAERTAGANVALGSNAQGVQAGIANAGNSVQSSSNILQSILAGRGQDFNQANTNRASDLDQLRMALSQAQGNQGAGITQRGQDQSSILQNQAQGNQFGLRAGEINSANQATNNSNQIDISKILNMFNQTNTDNSARYGLGTNELNARQGQLDQDRFLDQIKMGLGQNNVGNANQMGLLQMLFGGMQQANGLGTPGAQTIMQQNPWMQLLQTGVGLGGSWLQGGR